MRVLSIVHIDTDPPGLFADVAEERGHEHDEWWVHRSAPAPPAIDTYDAVAVFGGDMAVGEEAKYPWLREEKQHLRRLVADGVPVFGVCLGGQLLADAIGAQVSRARQPEVGWYDVELTEEAKHDPVFRGLPDRFPAFQWHSWQFALPSGGRPLARNGLCLQAYRYRDAAWGVQFHPEVKPDKLAEWLEAAKTHPEAESVGFDFERERERTAANAAGWNAVGRHLFSRFLEIAEARVRSRGPRRARASA